MQSNVGNTIKEAKEFLDNDRLVLFSGTPCQIAGLKAYLKQDYKNLITIDLSCTGTPSLNIFNDYIKFLEKKYKQKIVNFEFRNKEKFGWSCGSALITFKGGKQKVLYNNISSYFNLFLNKKLQKESCQNCKFAGLERVSDITVADAWGVENEYPELLKTKFDKNKGISLVLINTSKGFDILNSLKEELITSNIEVACMQKYNNPLNKIIINNFDNSYINEYKNSGYIGIEKLFRKNLGNKYYYYIIKNHTPQWIKNIVKVFIKKEKKVDCLLMTWYWNKNYGSIMAAYSLYRAIKNLGFSIKCINSELPTFYAKSFCKKYIQLTQYCHTNKSYENLNELSEKFIVGSDNQLNFSAESINVYRNLLDFTNFNSKKMIISGSCGNWDMNCNEQDKEILKTLFERFDYITLREKNAQCNLQNKFNIASDWVIDPVFYIKKEDYDEIINSEKIMDYNNKIMSYILYPNDTANKILKHLGNTYCIETADFYGNDIPKKCFKDKTKSVENWLKAVRDSKFVVTDSFHCTALCLIFNRPVICIKNNKDTSRFTSVFKKLNVNIPIIDSFEEFINQQPINMNWNEVNFNIEKERKYILNKINENLKSGNNKTDKQKFAEEKLNRLKKTFYKKHEILYKKNYYLYKNIVYPIFIPMVRKIKRVINSAKNN